MTLPITCNSPLTFKKNAFTLVEISVVLIIIALVIGGVLVGRDLLTTARNRAVIKEQDQIKIAYNTFILKYQCIPGDCVKAIDLFSSSNGIYRGNGDDRITGLSLNAAGTVAGGGIYEENQFWRHLQMAGLIQGEYRGTRANHGVAPFQGYIYGGSTATDYPTKYAVDAGYRAGWPTVFYNSYGFFYNNAVQLSSICDSSPYSGCTIVRSIDAWHIDEKVDDGMPGHGKIEAQNGWSRDSSSFYVCHGANALESAAQRAKPYTKGTGECTMMFYLN